MKVSRATNFQEFRAAFKTFAVSGQNMLYADVDGNIGQVSAVKLPMRPNGLPADVLVSPAESDAAWAEMTDVSSLPVAFNPDDGFLLSANNRPAPANVPLGYFFSPDDRMVRMREIVSQKSRLDVSDIKGLQRDVYMTSSVELRDALVPLLEKLNPTDAGEREIVTLMAGWDGHYRAESRGALAFELFYAAFKKRFAVSLMGERDADTYAGIGRIKSLLIEDLARADAETVAADLRPALESAAEAIASFADWGEMHRLAISHPMGFLPVIGSRYRFADYPVGGSSHSIMKTAHSTTDERHNTRFGSNARHISDMSDMDRNYFVLLGGQDGWFKSANFLDQVPYWLSGNYVQVPMRLDVVRKSFARKTVFGASPTGSGN